MSKRTENTTKRAYLVKIAGSIGSIYDFSNVHVLNEDEMNSKCIQFGSTTHTIKYAYYDERIHFHKWNVLNVDGHHLFWILSPTEESPALSEWDIMDEGM